MVSTSKGHTKHWLVSNSKFLNEFSAHFKLFQELDERAADISSELNSTMFPRTVEELMLNSEYFGTGELYIAPVGMYAEKLT